MTEMHHLMTIRTNSAKTFRPTASGLVTFWCLNFKGAATFRVKDMVTDDICIDENW